MPPLSPALNAGQPQSQVVLFFRKFLKDTFVRIDFWLFVVDSSTSVLRQLVPLQLPEFFPPFPVSKILQKRFVDLPELRLGSPSPFLYSTHQGHVYSLPVWTLLTQKSCILRPLWVVISPHPPFSKTPLFHFLQGRHLVFIFVGHQSLHQHLTYLSSPTKISLCYPTPVPFPSPRRAPEGSVLRCDRRTLTPQRIISLRWSDLGDLLLSLPTGIR